MRNKKKSEPRKKPRRNRILKKGAIERQYEQNFTPLRLPYHGVYTDEDSLEQPSGLEDVPTTSVPYVEAYAELA
jgi:hypothetical protein